MRESSAPESPRTLCVTGRTGDVIPVINDKQNRTVGIMTWAGSHDLDCVVVLMTPDDARRIAAELIEYANR